MSQFAPHPSSSLHLPRIRNMRWMIALLAVAAAIAVAAVILLSNGDSDTSAPVAAPATR
jgi:hypothetical protein